MELKIAERLAKELINEHLAGKGWRFGWNNRKKAYGVCNYKNSVISLSRYSTSNESEESVRDTILHEIAHAIAGYEARHGRVWKMIARSIGLKNPAAGRRLENPAAAPAPKWVAVYKTEVVGNYYRRPGASRFTNVHKLYCKGRKAETIGKLRIISYTQHIGELMRQEGSLKIS